MTEKQGGKGEREKERKLRRKAWLVFSLLPSLSKKIKGAVA